MFNPQAQYHQVLKSEFETRTKANARYSLRAFARDLGLAPSRLSRVLRGEEGLSQTTAAKVAVRLGLSPNEQAKFCEMVVAVDGRSKRARRAASAAILQSASKDPDVRALEDDIFHVVSDWYHFAMVELAGQRGVDANPKSIAKRLGISAIEAENALERLISVGLLAKESGRIVRTKNMYAVPTQSVPSDAVRKFNRQILEKAISAISLQGIEERSLGTVTVAVAPKSLPRLFEELAAFRRKFNTLAEALAQEAGANASEVYVLSLPFFKVTQSSQEKRK